MTLTVLKGTGQIFCGTSLTWGLSNVCLMVGLRLWAFRRKIPAFKCSSHHVASRHVLSASPLDVSLHRQAERVFARVRFSHCSAVLSLLSILYSLEGADCVKYAWGLGTCAPSPWGGVCNYINYSELFWMGDFSMSPIYVLSHLFIPVWMHGYLFDILAYKLYHLGYKWLYDLLCWSVCTIFVYGSTWASVTCPHHFMCGIFADLKFYFIFI